MTEVNAVAKSTTHSLRSITLLLAAAAGLAIAGVPSISQGQSRWVTVASTEGAAIYAASSSEAACRAVQADASVIRLSGSDLRQVSDEQVVAVAGR